MRSNRYLTEMQNCFSPSWHLFRHSNFFKSINPFKSYAVYLVYFIPIFADLKVKKPQCDKNMYASVTFERVDRFWKSFEKKYGRNCLNMKIWEVPPFLDQRFSQFLDQLVDQFLNQFLEQFLVQFLDQFLDQCSRSTFRLT